MGSKFRVIALGARVVVPAYRYYVAPVRVYAHGRVVGSRIYSAPDGWR